MKFSKVAMPSCSRPVALTMPWVTVCGSPNGLPMASTTSPTCSRSERPRLITGSGLDRQQCQVGVRIAPHHLGVGAAAVGELHPDEVALAMT